jgi:SP family myo-inositol transporter-like MFS transporter 13
LLFVIVSFQYLYLFLAVCGISISLATATNWAGNLLIGSTHLSLMAKITPAGASGFYTGLCFLGWIFVLGCFPETVGLRLEEVKMVFRNGFGIKESQRLRKRKQDIKERDKGRLEMLDDVATGVEGRDEGEDLIGSDE